MWAVFCRISGDSTILELLDPFGWVREPIATGDSERRKTTVFDVPIRGLGEHFDIPDKMGLHELDGFVVVIQFLLELRFLGSQILGEAMGPRF